MRPQEFVTRKGEAFDVLFPFRELTLICTVLGTCRYELGTGLPSASAKKTGVSAGFARLQTLFRLALGTSLAAGLAWYQMAAVPVFQRSSSQAFLFGLMGCTAM